MHLRHVFIVILIGLWPAAAAAGLRVGAYAQDISPETFPVVYNGDFFTHSADKVTAPLYARTLVLDDGKTRVVMCVIDSCGVGREMLDEIKARASKSTGIPVDRMMLSATHTHSAPAVGSGLGVDADEAYVKLFVPRVVEGIERAAKDLRPVKVGWAVVKDWEHTHCRQWVYRPDRMLTDPFGGVTVRVNMHPGYQNVNTIGPSGPVDPDLSVLSFQTPDGKPVALLANYSMHYYGAAPISPDYFGLFCKKMEKMLAPNDPAFVAVMSQGTSGDMHWMDYGKPANAPGLDPYAEAVAKRAHEAYQTIQYRDDADLAMAESLLRLRQRVPDDLRLLWARGVMKGVRGRLPQTHPEVYAREAIFMHENPEQELKLQALRVGDLGFTAIPNEVFALTGLKIKTQSPLTHTVNIELANGAFGYIPPAELHPLGGYTTWPARSAGLEIGAEAKIADALLGLLEKVAGKPRRPVVDAHGPYAQAVLGSKPVAYWRLNELAGPTAGDATGQLPATLEAGVLPYLEGPDSPAFTGEGVINRAMHLAGGRVTAQPKTLGTTYSIEWWFWNGLAAEARPVTAYLFSRGENGAIGAPGDHVGIGGSAGSSGKLFVFNGNHLNGGLGGQTVIPTKTWNHVLYVRDGKRVTIYLNGNPKPEVTGEVEAGHPPDCTQLFFGGRSDDLFGLEGKLDEVAVYDRALTPEDAAAHYKAAGLPTGGNADASR